MQLSLLRPLLGAITLAAACLSSAYGVQAPKEATVGISKPSAVLPGQKRRIALVIGNSDYQHPDNLPALANPVNDAEDIAEALRILGFEVIARKNQTLEAMNEAVAEFGSRIGGSEAALFYFAGHGIQVKNQNFLMPVDAKIESEAAVPYKGLNMNQVLDELDNGKSSVNIVMLDACRNNPITGKFRSGKSRGLASPGNVPKGTVIVYATDPGNVAADGEGRNGLFTTGLLTAFQGNDLTLDGVLTVASAEVERLSGQAQTPYVDGPKTLQKNFDFRIGALPKMATQARVTTQKTPQKIAESKSSGLESQPKTETGKAAATQQTEDEWSAGKTLTDCTECPEMLVIPAGSFEMGSNKDDSPSMPAHTVRIAKPFALAKTEVTQRQWRFVMGANPSYFQNCDDCPVESIVWSEAQEFVRKLSQKTGKSYRLPSEAEWEYACRAGGKYTYCGDESIDRIAWYGSNSGNRPHTVAERQPNAWGLYDMSGNVWKWTEDCANDHYNGAPTDGSAWTSGNCGKRVVRGGAWNYESRNTRAIYRGRYDAAYRYFSFGFRPVRTLP